MPRTQTPTPSLRQSLRSRSRSPTPIQRQDSRENTRTQTSISPLGWSSHSHSISRSFIQCQISADDSHTPQPLVAQAQVMATPQASSSSLAAAQFDGSNDDGELDLMAVDDIHTVLPEYDDRPNWAMTPRGGSPVNGERIGPQLGSLRERLPNNPYQALEHLMAPQKTQLQETDRLYMNGVQYGIGLGIDSYKKGIATEIEKRSAVFSHAVLIDVQRESREDLADEIEHNSDIFDRVVAMRAAEKWTHNAVLGTQAHNVINSVDEGSQINGGNAGPPSSDSFKVFVDPIAINSASREQDDQEYSQFVEQAHQLHSQAPNQQPTAHPENPVFSHLNNLAHVRSQYPMSLETQVHPGMHMLPQFVDPNDLPMDRQYRPLYNCELKSHAAPTPYQLAFVDPGRPNPRFDSEFLNAPLFGGLPLNHDGKFGPNLDLDQGEKHRSQNHPVSHPGVLTDSYLDVSRSDTAGGPQATGFQTWRNMKPLNNGAESDCASWINVNFLDPDIESQGLERAANDERAEKIEQKILRHKQEDKAHITANNSKQSDKGKRKACSGHSTYNDKDDEASTSSSSANSPDITPTPTSPN